MRINFHFGHLDRMPRCQHGRVICNGCGLPLPGSASGPTAEATTEGDGQ